MSRCWQRVYDIMNLPSGNYEASSFGMTPQTADNGPALTAALATIRASGRGGRIWFEPAPYNFQTAVTDTTASVSSYGVELMGAGQGSTYFKTDGALNTTGNLLTPGRYFRAYNMTLGSTATRAAGSFVRVVGDMLIGDAPSKKLMGIQFGDVDMENGFDGVTLVDRAGSLGVCGFSWEGRTFARGFTASGTLFDVNSPNGVIITINNVSHSETSGVASGSRPLATMRVRGAADLRCENVESVYCRNGLVVDPGATGRAATLFLQNCIWGQVTGDPVLISPNASADCHSIQMIGGYVDTTTGITITGSGCKSVQIVGMTVYGCTTGGIKANATGSVVASEINWAGNNLFGFYATGSQQNFQVSGSFSEVSAKTTTGVLVDAGCNRYQVSVTGANDHCTTAVTDNGGANKVVSVL